MFPPFYSACYGRNNGTCSQQWNILPVGKGSEQNSPTLLSQLQALSALVAINMFHDWDDIKLDVMRVAIEEEVYL